MPLVVIDREGFFHTYEEVDPHVLFVDDIHRALEGNEYFKYPFTLVNTEKNEELISRHVTLSDMGIMAHTDIVLRAIPHDSLKGGMISDTRERGTM